LDRRHADFQSAAPCSDPGRKLDLGLIHAKHVSLDAVEMPHVRGQVVCASVATEFVDSRREALDKSSMRNESEVDHRVDVALIIRTVSTLDELAASSSPASKRWGIATSIDTDDFVNALKASRVDR
jgi:hypothetical protein